MGDQSITQAHTETPDPLSDKNPNAAPPGGTSTPGEEVGHAAVFPSDGCQEKRSTNPPAPDTDSPGEQVPMEKYQEALQAKDELLDLLLRRQAEFENMRRRTEREKSEFLQLSLFNFISELLPVLDGFERALGCSQGSSLEDLKTGVELLYRQFRCILEGAGLKTINSQGQGFDPNLHFAVMKEETLAVPDQQILEEFLKGYLFKERLLRPSMVKVAVAQPSGSLIKEEVMSEKPEC